MSQLIYHPLRARLLQVLSVEALSPRLRRITLGGPELEGFVSPMPDDHVKLLLPAPGETLPVLPTFSDKGATFPDGAVRPVARDYTPRAFDLQRQTLTLDFVLHGDGPACTWAASAKPGDQVGVAGPRASHVLDPNAHAHWLLLGDETALPAIARWLEWLPQQARVTVRIEVGRAEDRIQLPAHEGLDLVWLHRESQREDCSLLAEIRRLDLPGGFAWIACESAQMRGLRQHLLSERGWPREQLYAAGYWKRGASDHDHEH
ncbi:NADPH-dependent ferric siderophore reductase [Paucibacter aquatile]|uniref:NADPH-dependent ferric siderophore reductase n=1 Tax=Kinneretia aquatilis TaxID=2070761 RepID=A0A2N8KTV1_9BURK|nr:siderophore-interacting protein [Paucibacter aquatile]PND36883.1 NADPH-dependent ferric siderophore reductase [Paucibacter aquatile]